MKTITFVDTQGRSHRINIENIAQVYQEGCLEQVTVVELNTGTKVETRASFADVGDALDRVQGAA